MNYCRQFRKWIDRSPNGKALSALAQSHLAFMDIATKFTLPNRGKLFDGDSWDFLTDAAMCNLPFENILLEYGWDGDHMPSRDNTFNSSRRIVLVYDKGNTLVVSAVWKYDDGDLWGAGPWLRYTKANLIEATAGSRLKLDVIRNDYAVLADKLGVLDQVIPDTAEEVSVVTHFLAALACRNVGVAEVSQPRCSKSKKPALRYDSYYRLTIGGDASSGGGGEGNGRSPREHLRRGHIRRLKGGNVWIQPTVVNPGTTGKVTKEYALAERVINGR